MHVLKQSAQRLTVCTTLQSFTFTGILTGNAQNAQYVWCGLEALLEPLPKSVQRITILFTSHACSYTDIARSLMVFRKADWKFLQRALDSRSLEFVKFGVAFQERLLRDQGHYMATLQRRLETEVKDKLRSAHSYGIIRFGAVVSSAS